MSCNCLLFIKQAIIQNSASFHQAMFKFFWLCFRKWCLLVLFLFLSGSQYRLWAAHCSGAVFALGLCSLWGVRVGEELLTCFSCYWIYQSFNQTESPEWLLICFLSFPSFSSHLALKVLSEHCTRSFVYHIPTSSVCHLYLCRSYIESCRH